MINLHLRHTDTITWRQRQEVGDYIRTLNDIAVWRVDEVVTDEQDIHLYAMRVSETDAEYYRQLWDDWDLPKATEETVTQKELLPEVND